MNYTTSKQTVSEEAMDDLCRITKEYQNGVYSLFDTDEFFTKNDLKFYLEVLQTNLQDENKHFFCLQYDKQRYIECLIDTIKSLIVQLMGHKYVMFLNSHPIEDEGGDEDED